MPCRDAMPPIHAANPCCHAMPPGGLTCRVDLPRRLAASTCGPRRAGPSPEPWVPARPGEAGRPCCAGRRRGGAGSHGATATFRPGRPHIRRPGRLHSPCCVTLAVFVRPKAFRGGRRSRPAALSDRERAAETRGRRGAERAAGRRSGWWRGRAARHRAPAAGRDAGSDRRSSGRQHRRAARV